MESMGLPPVFPLLLRAATLWNFSPSAAAEENSRPDFRRRIFRRKAIRSLCNSDYTVQGPFFLLLPEMNLKSFLFSPFQFGLFLSSSGSTTWERPEEPKRPPEYFRWSAHTLGPNSDVDGGGSIDTMDFRLPSFISICKFRRARKFAA